MTTIGLEPAGGRLARLLGLLVLGFGVGVVLLSPSHLILALNGLAMSVAAGVATAYLPIAGRALRRRRPSRGDVLGIGIFLAGLADVALRFESIIARDLGWPGIFNTHIAAISIFLVVMALVSFLWAPHAEHGEVPREKWGRAGLMVAVGVAIALAAGLAQYDLRPSPLVRLE